MALSKRGLRSVLLLATALVLVLPSVGRDGSTSHAAVAKDRGGGDDGGSDNSGHGGGDDDGGSDNSGHGGGDGGDDDDGNGHGGHGGDDGAGDDNGGDRDRRGDDRSGRGGGDIRVVVRGDVVQVTYPDGWRETVRRGWIELRDPRGRVVATRRLREDDRRRINGYAR